MKLLICVLASISITLGTASLAKASHSLTRTACALVLAKKLVERHLDYQDLRLTEFKHGWGDYTFKAIDSRLREYFGYIVVSHQTHQYPLTSIELPDGTQCELYDSSMYHPFMVRDSSGQTVMAESARHYGAMKR